MLSKSRASYTRLYQMMDMAMAGQGIALHPNLSIMMDFELAERLPWKMIYSSQSVQAC